MRIVTATPGLRGIDCNAALNANQARALKAKGFGFIMRYVRRDAAAGSDLSKVELAMLVSTGLLVGIVQHVHPGTWAPTPELGARYGAAAYQALGQLGVPGGAPIWCDLEMSDPAVMSLQVIAYVNAWTNQVSGYDPGLYLGYQPGLSAFEAFHRLNVKRYWRAYNGDVIPAIRGFQLVQQEATERDRDNDVELPPFDVNIVTADRLGDLPVFIGA